MMWFFNGDGGFGADAVSVSGNKVYLSKDNFYDYEVITVPNVSSNGSLTRVASFGNTIMIFDTGNVNDMEFNGYIHLSTNNGLSWTRNQFWSKTSDYAQREYYGLRDLYYTGGYWIASTLSVNTPRMAKWYYSTDMVNWTLLYKQPYNRPQEGNYKSLMISDNGSVVLCVDTYNIRVADTVGGTLRAVSMSSLMPGVSGSTDIYSVTTSAGNRWTLSMRGGWVFETTNNFASTTRRTDFPSGSTDIAIDYENNVNVAITGPNRNTIWRQSPGMDWTNVTPSGWNQARLQFNGGRTWMADNGSSIWTSNNRAESFFLQPKAAPLNTLTHTTTTRRAVNKIYVNY